MQLNTKSTVPPKHPAETKLPVHSHSSGAPLLDKTTEVLNSVQFALPIHHVPVAPIMVAVYSSQQSQQSPVGHAIGPPPELLELELLVLLELLELEQHSQLLCVGSVAVTKLPPDVTIAPPSVRSPVAMLKPDRLCGLHFD